MNAGDALRLAAHFGVEGVGAHELEGGYSNENWRVMRADATSVVVRKYGRLHVTRRAVFFEHAVMRHAAAHLPAVHASLAGPDGDSILLDEGSFIAVVPYVEGVTGERAAAPAAAEALAAFHRAMVDFHPPRPRATRTVGALAWLRNRLLRFAADPSLARRLPWDAVILAVSGALARFVPHAARLPLSTVHGDPHPDNFVVDRGKIVALLDFDFTHETERAYDVATAADAFARADEDAPLDRDAAEAFAHAYHVAAPLATEEWRFLPELMIRRNAMLVWYVVTRHGERAAGDIGNAERYARRVAELDAWARERRPPAP